MAYPVTAADTLLRVGRAYPMTPDRGTCRAVAISAGRILATDQERDGLDALIDAHTTIIDDQDLVLFPAFNDTHNHQLLAARDLDFVELEPATTIDDLVAALRAVADRTPDGEWIISSRCWHETHLREGRLPTATELDAASTRHPILVQRGGHVGVASTRALDAAGITARSDDPPSGTVLRHQDRTPTGVLIEAGALDPVRRLLPQFTHQQQAGLLARQPPLFSADGRLSDSPAFRRCELVFCSGTGS